MTKKFYGIVETNEVTIEKYVTQNKQGKDVTKTRKKSVPKSLLVTTAATSRLEAMKEVKATATKVSGKVSFVGAFK